MDEGFHKYVFISIILVIGVLTLSGIFFSSSISDLAVSVDKISGAVTSSLSSPDASSASAMNEGLLPNASISENIDAI